MHTHKLRKWLSGKAGRWGTEMEDTFIALWTVLKNKTKQNNNTFQDENDAQKSFYPVQCELKTRTNGRQETERGERREGEPTTLFSLRTTSFQKIGTMFNIQNKNQ